MRLPVFADLSKEQDFVNSLSLEGSFLVVGPPGSGKSVVALYRAQMMQARKLSPQIVTYSKVLSRYIESGSVAARIVVDSCTYHSWVAGTYRRLYRVPPPKPPGHAGRFKFDWDKIVNRLVSVPPEKGLLPALIVDEGQDMPAQFYLVASYLTRSMTVFADENQRITRDQCTIEQIRAASGISKANVFELRKNYRNTREIATLASEYYCGLRSGIAEIPERSGRPVELIQIKSDRTCAIMINRFFEQNPRAEIGVLLPSKDLVKRFVALLHAIVSDKSKLSWYYREFDQAVGKPNFDLPGINVLTHASAKGLEFDAVFLPQLQAMHQTDPTEASFRMQLYVLFSRARERLFISYVGEKSNIIKDVERSLNRTNASIQVGPGF